MALGSNLGDRAETIRSAVIDLARLPLVDDVRVADVIESVALRPEGPDADAPAYLNTVALVTTRLAPSVLLAYLHAIEVRHGRERTERWGDRTLDLDLIAYGDARSDTADAAAAAPARSRARLRPRTLAHPRSRRGAARRRARRRAAPPAESRFVKRTGAGVLAAAGAIGVAAGFLVDQVLTAAGRPTFVPGVTLPILLVLLGGFVIVLALPIRRATRGTTGARPVDPFRALRIAMLAKASSIVGSAFAGIRRRARALPRDKARDAHR